MRSCGAGASLAPLILRASALYSVSTSRVDLPPPETPVTQVNRPSGISAVMFFRLLPRALTTLSARRALRGRRSGIGTTSSPERYLPVSEFELRDQVGDLALRRRSRRRGCRRRGRCRAHGRRCGWRPRRARPRSRCCRGRAAASAFRAAARCRAGAGRSRARRARRARRSGPSRSARRGGCAGSRRRTACRRRAASVRYSRPTSTRNFSRSRISFSTRTAISFCLAVSLLRAAR